MGTFVFHKHKTFTFGQRNINMVIEEIRPTSPEQIPTTWWSCSTWWSDSHLDLKWSLPPGSPIFRSIFRICCGQFPNKFPNTPKLISEFSCLVWWGIFLYSPALFREVKNLRDFQKMSNYCFENLYTEVARYFFFCISLSCHVLS